MFSHTFILGFLKFLFPVCFFWLFLLSGSIDIQCFTTRKQILKKKIMSRYNHRIFPVFFFSKTVICYLYRKKFIYGNCQLSTVTLAIDIGFALMMSETYDFLSIHNVMEVIICCY